MACTIQNAAKCLNCSSVYLKRFVFSANGSPIGRQLDIISHLEMDARAPLPVVNVVTNFRKVLFRFNDVRIALGAPAFGKVKRKRFKGQLDRTADRLRCSAVFCRCRYGTPNIIFAFRKAADWFHAICLI